MSPGDGFIALCPSSLGRRRLVAASLRSGVMHAGSEAVSGISQDSVIANDSAVLTTAATTGREGKAGRPMPGLRRRLYIWLVHFKKVLFSGSAVCP
jgi:hypothetical protein